MLVNRLLNCFFVTHLHSNNNWLVNIDQSKDVKIIGCSKLAYYSTVALYLHNMEFHCLKCGVRITCMSQLWSSSFAFIPIGCSWLTPKASKFVNSSCIDFKKNPDASGREKRTGIFCLLPLTQWRCMEALVWWVLGKKCCEVCIVYKEKDLTPYIHLTHEWLQNWEKLTLLGK